MIYMEAFRISPIEALNVETNMRKNELGLRFLYKLKINLIYTESLITLDDSKDYNYENKERATRLIGVHFIILE